MGAGLPGSAHGPDRSLPARPTVSRQDPNRFRQLEIDDRSLTSQSTTCINTLKAAAIAEAGVFLPHSTSTSYHRLRIPTRLTGISPDATPQPPGSEGHGRDEPFLLHRAGRPSVPA